MPCLSVAFSVDQHAAGHLRTSLQGRVQKLLQVTGTRLHPSVPRWGGHICPHLRVSGFVSDSNYGTDSNTDPAESKTIDVHVPFKAHGSS